MNATSARRLDWEALRQVTQRTRTAKATARAREQAAIERSKQAGQVSAAVLEQVISPKAQH